MGVSHCIVTSNDLSPHMTKHKQPIKMRAYVSITIYDFAKEIDCIAQRVSAVSFLAILHINMRHLPRMKEKEKEN